MDAANARASSSMGSTGATTISWTISSSSSKEPAFSLRSSTLSTCDRNAAKGSDLSNVRGSSTTGTTGIPRVVPAWMAASASATFIAASESIIAASSSAGAGYPSGRLDVSPLTRGHSLASPLGQAEHS